MVFKTFPIHFQFWRYFIYSSDNEGFLYTHALFQFNLYHDVITEFEGEKMKLMIYYINDDWTESFFSVNKTIKSIFFISVNFFASSWTHPGLPWTMNVKLHNSSLCSSISKWGKPLKEAFLQKALEVANFYRFNKKPVLRQRFWARFFFFILIISWNPLSFAANGKKKKKHALALWLRFYSFP